MKVKLSKSHLIQESVKIIARDENENHFQPVKIERKITKFSDLIPLELKIKWIKIDNFKTIKMITMFVTYNVFVIVVAMSNCLLFASFKKCLHRKTKYDGTFIDFSLLFFSNDIIFFCLKKNVMLCCKFHSPFSLSCLLDNNERNE